MFFMGAVNMVMVVVMVVSIIMIVFGMHMMVVVAVLVMIVMVLMRAPDVVNLWWVRMAMLKDHNWCLEFLNVDFRRKYWPHNHALWWCLLYEDVWHFDGLNDNF